MVLCDVGLPLVVLCDVGLVVLCDVGLPLVVLCDVGLPLVVLCDVGLPLVVSGGLCCKYIGLCGRLDAEAVFSSSIYTIHTTYHVVSPVGGVKSFGKADPRQIFKSVMATPQTRIFNIHTFAKTNHVNFRFHIMSNYYSTQLLIIIKQIPYRTL